MSWQEVEDCESWDRFLFEQPNGTFLQSWEFGDSQVSLGKKIWHFGYNTKDFEGVCLLLKQEAKFGNFLYIPGGPVLTDDQALDSLISIVTQVAKEEKVNFIRFDPRVISPNLASQLTSLGLRKVNNFTQPECTLILDLREDLEVIKGRFSESTRYNIGWVERQGVTVKASEEESDIEIFARLLSQTSERKGFRLPLQSDYYKKQFAVFKEAGMAKLYLAYEPEQVGKEALAAAVVVKFGKTTTYLHAASSSKNPKLRAPYLMQWKIIEDAKASGSEIYDFWGASPDDKVQDSWSGVTAFKRGFGGERVCYSPPYDLVLGKQYYFDMFLEKLRLLSRKWRS